MSLMKTLAKVAVGVAVAKGVSGMMKKSQQSQTAQRDGGLFGQSNARNLQSGGGIEDMLGSIMGGQGQSGGLGGLLENLGGGGRSGGGLNDILGQLAGNSKGQSGGLSGLLNQLGGGRQQSGGGIGSMLGGLLGGAAAAQASRGGFGDMLNQAIARQDEPETTPNADQEALAALMLRAMIHAMKSDGHIDDTEQQRLLSRLGDVSEEERAFVMAEMQSNVDADALARDVPKGLEPQIYAMSVMGIDLDSQEEAQYLHKLASAMGLNQQVVNNIHEEMGVPSLYT